MHTLCKSNLNQFFLEILYLHIIIIILIFHESSPKVISFCLCKNICWFTPLNYFAYIYVYIYLSKKRVSTKTPAKSKSPRPPYSDIEEEQASCNSVEVTSDTTDQVVTAHTSPGFACLLIRDEIIFQHSSLDFIVGTNNVYYNVVSTYCCELCLMQTLVININLLKNLFKDMS